MRKKCVVLIGVLLMTVFSMAACELSEAEGAATAEANNPEPADTDSATADDPGDEAAMELLEVATYSCLADCRLRQTCWEGVEDADAIASTCEDICEASLSGGFGHLVVDGDCAHNHEEMGFSTEGRCRAAADLEATELHDEQGCLDYYHAYYELADHTATRLKYHQWCARLHSPECLDASLAEADCLAELNDCAAWEYGPQVEAGGCYAENHAAVDACIDLSFEILTD